MAVSASWPVFELFAREPFAAQQIVALLELKGHEMRTAKSFLVLTFYLILVIASAKYAQAQAPVLLTEPNSSRAIALDSAIRIRDPLPVVAIYALRTNERRTRVAFFGTNMALNQGE